MPETTPTGPEASSAIDRLSLSVSSPRGSAVSPAIGAGNWSINPMCFEAAPAVNGPHGTPNCVCFEGE